MAKQGMASFQINDISIDWSEDSRRVEKPCISCGQPTRGRMKNGGGIVKAAHMLCGFGTVTVKAMEVYGRKV